MRRLRSRAPNWTDRSTPTSSNNTQSQRNSIHIDRAKLINLTRNYESYSSSVAPGVTVKEGLCNLEDVTAYGVSSETAQQKLWELEIDRLSLAVMDSDKPVRFAGTDELSHDTKDTYENLAHLADQIWIAMNIVMLDSQTTLSIHFPILSEDDQLSRSRQILERFTGEDDEDEDEDSPETGPSNGGRKGSHEDYFELVDYLTATLARALCKAASGEAWHHHVLSNLVKLSTKLKVVSVHLEESASNSLENSPRKKSVQLPSAPANRGHTAVETSMGRDGHGGGSSLGALGDMLNAIHCEDGSTEKAYSGPNTRQKAVKQMYWLQTVKFKRPLHLIFQHILVSLRGQNQLATTSTTSYEMCAMVFDTNFQEFPTLVYQDVNGEYLGASKPENISVANAVFEELNTTIQSLNEMDSPLRNTDVSANGAPSRISNEESAGTNTSGTAVSASPSSRMDPQSDVVGTTISWCYTAIDSGSQTQPAMMQLKSMNEVITVMIPLLLASPKVIDMITDFIGLCVHTAESEKIRLHPTTKYKATFCLNTEEYRRLWEAKPPSPVSQLSRSPIAGDATLSRKDGGPHQKDSPVAVYSQKYQQDLQAVTKAMDEWIYEENGVRVRCEWYVWTVLIIAFTLALGGIASGVTIHNRLTGVDPFNITTFCWVVAVFVTLIAKSLRVSNWPWRDFLRRNVLCRSVSELHSVTGIDEQLILGRLLQDESANRLQTRGPYNCVFSQKTSSADGFSIDHPMSFRAMLLSGLIIIQVQAIYRGEFLVCLDLRKGTDYHVVLQSKNPTDNREYIVSDRLVVEAFQTIPRQRIPLQKSKDAQWNRVVGIYGEQDCFFT